MVDRKPCGSPRRCYTDQDGFHDEKCFDSSLPGALGVNHLAVTGADHHLDVRPDAHHFHGQHVPGHAGHGLVGDHQVERLRGLILKADPGPGSGWSQRRSPREPSPLEGFPAEPPGQAGLGVDEHDPFLSPRWAGGERASA